MVDLKKMFFVLILRTWNEFCNSGFGIKIPDFKTKIEYLIALTYLHIFIYRNILTSKPVSLYLL